MNTDVYNIAKKTFNGATQKPIYKLDGGVVYIYYFPDAYGWRMGDLPGTENAQLYYLSKYCHLYPDKSLFYIQG